MGLKNEFTKKPEDLTESQLKKASGLANILTSIRQVSYFSIEMIVMMWVVYTLYNMLIYPIDILLILVGVAYGIFKLRDFVRGDI